MWARILAIMLKELRQLSRDRMTFGMIVMIPLVQLLLFGYAINTDARHLPAGLVDMSASSYSRALVQAVKATQVVDFKAKYASIEQAEAAITSGEVRAVLYLPADLNARLVNHPPSTVVKATASLPGPWPSGWWMARIRLSPPRFVA